MAKEQRLIDANALRQEIESRYYWGGAGMLAAIDEAPTVDAVPVVHGHWIEKKLDNFRKWELQCSECGWIGISNYDAYDEPFDFNYCPNCGAKMDGDVNG